MQNSLLNRLDQHIRTCVAIDLPHPLLNLTKTHSPMPSLLLQRMPDQSEQVHFDMQSRQNRPTNRRGLDSSHESRADMLQATENVLISTTQGSGGQPVYVIRQSTSNTQTQDPLVNPRHTQAHHVDTAAKAQQREHNLTRRSPRTMRPCTRGMVTQIPLPDHAGQRQTMALKALSQAPITPKSPILTTILTRIHRRLPEDLFVNLSQT